MPSQLISRTSIPEGSSITRQVMADAVAFYLDHGGPAVAREHVEKLANDLKFYGDSSEAYCEAIDQIDAYQKAERKKEERERQQMQDLVQSMLDAIQGDQPEPDLPLTETERMKRALDCLEREQLLNHRYDYIWIMRFINEHHLKGVKLFFYSVESYREFLIKQMGQKRVGSKSTLSEYNKYVSGRFPDWTFSDTNDTSEWSRRTNIVRRFAAIFVKGR